MAATTIPPKSEGARLLAKWLEKQRLPQRQLAITLGVSAQAMSNYLAGRSFPSLSVATAIQELSDGAVPSSAWTKKIEKKR